MDLILWRHAEAEEAAANLPDTKRRLTARGEKQAALMAAWLNNRLPKKTRILVSPSVRTQQTAHALGKPFEIEPAIAPGAGSDAVLKAAGWPDHDRVVLVVGHQPTLGEVAAQLLAGRDESWSVKKGAIWWLRAKEPGGPCTLRAVLGPDLL